MKQKTLNKKIARQKIALWLYKIFRTGLIIGIAYVILYPLVVKVSVALMSREDMYDMTVRWIPKNPTLDNFKEVIKILDYKKYFFTTFFISASSTIIQVAVCTFAAYGFARFKFKLNGPLFVIVILTLIIPPQTYMVSSYMMFRSFDFFGLGALFGMKGIPLLNTPFPVLILSIGCQGVKNGLFIFIMRQFFKNLPGEIEESAWVDGAGVFSAFFKIMLPNAVPALTTITVFSFAWSFNDLYTDVTYMPKMALFPLAMSKITSTIMSTLGGRSAVDTVTVSMLTNAAVFLILIPMIIFFLLAQKFFVEGVERTGLTGS